MTKDYNNLGIWLPPLIDKEGVSIEQFARRCGVSRASIYAYISGLRRPETQTMARICHVLGVPLEEALAQYSERRRGRPPKRTGAF